MKALVIAEHDNHILKGATRALVTAALQIAEHVDVLVAGNKCLTVVTAASQIAGVSNVLVADHGNLQYPTSETLAALVLGIAADYIGILAAATTTGKNFLPRVAARLDVAQISEITAVITSDTFVRPIYAGNALATVKSTDSIKVMTVRTSAFIETPTGNTVAEIKNLAAVESSIHTMFISETMSESLRPELTAARIVISGGRGLGSAENFHLLDKVADKLGAAIGASRAAVDSGYAANDMQVGQTGKVVAPDLYIAVAISGAIQHLAGMKESKVIVAINKDAEAPIFQVADYGLVADLFIALPELEALL
ncbi:MAG: electron transfer flavoprotein subunit alpha/FixB family protein [Pseudohongiellaceae bacterium]